MDAAGVEDGPDLTGVRPTCSESFSRGLRWVTGSFFTLTVLVAVGWLFDDPDGFDITLSCVQVVLWALWFVVTFVLPPAIGLDQRGVRVRSFLWWGPPIPWDEVVEVRVQGRWQETSLLVRADGTSQRLTGMAVEDAEILAAALATWRAQ